MQKPIMNLDEIKLETQKQGEAFEAKMGAIGIHLGAKKLGYRLTVVPPGKKAWPYHNHYVNEEMFVILEGSGLFRYGDEEFPLRVGDVVCARAGGAATAHQLINTSSGDLKYLCISTMEEPEVMEYPDSHKLGVFAGSAPGGARENRTLSFFGRQSSAVDYWDGEDK